VTGPLALVAVSTVVINVPFGYWRAGVKKFSPSWYIAVHAAVPIVITMRLLAGIHWRVTTIGFLVSCYFLGQFLGTRLRHRLRPLAQPAPPEED